MVSLQCHGAVLEIHAAYHEILAETGLYLQNGRLHALLFLCAGGVGEQIELSELLMGDIAAGDVDAAYGALGIDYPVVERGYGGKPLRRLVGRSLESGAACGVLRAGKIYRRD